MAALDFPASPAVNDTYTSGSQTWKWNGITWDLITGTVVNTVAGTANQVLVNGGTAAVSGSPTLSLPQSIATSSSPSFSTITSTVATGTSPLTVTSTTQVDNLNANFLNGSVRPAHLTTTSFSGRTSSGTTQTAVLATLSLPAMAKAGRWFFSARFVMTAKTVSTDLFDVGVSVDSGSTYQCVTRWGDVANSTVHVLGSMTAAINTAYTAGIYFARQSGTGTATSGSGDGRFHAFDAWYISD